jgi:mevalonate kinase
MSSIILTVPSKTFLVGEYIALSGGPTLILNTEPRFELSATNTHSDNPCKQQGMRANSPAGKLLKLFQQNFNGYQLSFKDPHKGTGGFGASSAQFAIILVLEQLIKQQHRADLTVSTILDFYHQCSWSGQGLSPSGADVIGQMSGEITFYHASNHQLEKLSWPFPDIDFCLIRTGNKIATHRHLSSLATDPSCNQQLINIALASHQAIIDNNAKDFVDAIQQYGIILDNVDLVAPHTKQLLQKISQYPYVLATKGCGALGADVIIVIFESAQSNELLHWLKQQDLNVIVSSHKQLSVGIECQGLAEIQLKF